MYTEGKFTPQVNTLKMIALRLGSPASGWLQEFVNDFTLGGETHGSGTPRPIPEITHHFLASAHRFFIALRRGPFEPKTQAESGFRPRACDSHENKRTRKYPNLEWTSGTLGPMTLLDPPLTPDPYTRLWLRVCWICPCARAVAVIINPVSALHASLRLITTQPITARCVSI